MTDGGQIAPRSVLAAGCGVDPLTQWAESGYKITRLDIDPACNPDVVASLTDLGDIGTFDVVYCSHSLEHLYPHDVPRALSEFYRVLSPGGRLVILVPDLQDVPANDLVLPDGCGLSGLHLYYGDAAQIEANPYMAHHSGFVSSTLKTVMEAAGFDVKTERMSHYQLLGIGTK